MGEIHFDVIKAPVPEDENTVFYAAHLTSMPFMAGASMQALAKLHAGKDGRDMCDKDDPAHDRARGFIQAKSDREGSTGQSCYIDDMDI